MPIAAEQAFLNAIVANPDDDTPRLVFADWLDERGTDDDAVRAELIRIQCRIASLKGKERRGVSVLWQREKEIMKEHKNRWTQPLREMSVKQWCFMRGFIDYIVISAKKFVRNSKRIFEIAPAITGVRFPEAANEVYSLARCPELSHLTMVFLCRMCTCGGCRIQDEIVNLFHSKYAANIHKLYIDDNRLEASHIQAMLRKSKITKLTHLGLSYNPIGDDGIETLVTSDALRDLKELSITEVELTTRGINFLAIAQLPKLQELDLGSNNITPQMLRTLAKSPLMKQLRRINLWNNSINTAGAMVLTESAGFDTIETLDLRHNDIGDTAAEALRKRFGKRVKI